MTDQIEKVKKDHHSELDPYDYGCKINALIDHIHALEKRVEEIEGWCCHCPKTVRREYKHGIWIDCQRREHP